MECAIDQRFGRQGHIPICGPELSILLFAGLLTCALACQRFLHPLFLAGFQVKRVTLNFLDNVLLLHFPLEATQGIF
jgi:hypothetical protein